MFEKILSSIGTSLNRHNLPYMVVGGKALLLYREPRLTMDIDIALGVEYLDEILGRPQTH